MPCTTVAASVSANSGDKFLLALERPSTRRIVAESAHWPGERQPRVPPERRSPKRLVRWPALGWRSCNLVTEGLKLSENSLYNHPPVATSRQAITGRDPMSPPERWECTLKSIPRLIPSSPLGFLKYHGDRTGKFLAVIEKVEVSGPFACQRKQKGHVAPCTGC